MYELETFMFGFGIVIGYEAGKYITPDADCMGTTSSEGWLVNEIPILGHIIFGVLSSYGSIFRRVHRSFITHFPFISTSIRYLFVFWYPMLEIYRHKSVWATYLMIGMFIGTSLSDSIHAYLDWIRYPKSE